MEDDSHGEYVTDTLTFCWQIFDIDDFGSHEARRAASHKEILFLVGVSCQAKIANGQVMAILFAEDDILWLEISVDNVVPVKMGKSL